MVFKEIDNYIWIDHVGMILKSSSNEIYIFESNSEDVNIE